MAGNQNQAVRIYEKEYKGILSAVFDVTKAFSGVLAPIQIKDGVQQNAKAFSVKTNATPVVIGTYSTDANTAFGTGTGTGSRFGNMTEVIYQDEDVPYSYTLAIHEGLDRFTVNNDLDAAVADRLKLHSEAQTRDMNKKVGKFLSDNAGETENLADLQEETIKKLFNKAHTYIVNKEVKANMKAYVRPEIYSAIVDMASNTTAKNSSVSIDENKQLKYKGFVLEETPEQYFPTGTIGIFAPDEVVIPFVGINTARTVEAIDFNGVQLQAAGKGGNYILEDNKKAVIKITGTLA
nr:MAG TPA: major capsid protein [Caudoviricetes sp.]